MAKKWAVTIGIIFIVVGLIGLLGGWGILGADGVFMTNTAHDWVHLISGIIILAVGLWGTRNAAVTLKVFGVIYLIVAIWGFFASPVLGFIDVNGADNWLHLILGIVILWGGISSGKEGAAAPMSTPPQM